MDPALSGGVEAVCEYGIVRFQRPVAASLAEPAALAVPGRCRFGDWELRCEVALFAAGDAELGTVDAPVLDPFRPPPNPYGPGNRGIDYVLEPWLPEDMKPIGEKAAPGWLRNLLGLYERQKSGRGCKVSTSLLANGAWANATMLQAQLAGATLAVFVTPPRLRRRERLELTEVLGGP